MPHYRQHQDPAASHEQVRRLAIELAAGGGGPALDVGAAQGMLGQSLAGTGIVIDAVEPNPAWADLARPFYRQVFCTPIESAPLADNNYGLIICADVLEHTADPLAVLAKLRRAARADAPFVISLPNVAHVAVRGMLLFGQFPKMQRGILDKTHLQFFTRRTATQMLASAQLRVRRASPTGVPLEELLGRPPGGFVYRVLSAMQRLAMRLMPGLFAYQWILVAVPQPLPANVNTPPASASGAPQGGSASDSVATSP